MSACDVAGAYPGFKSNNSSMSCIYIVEVTYGNDMMENCRMPT